VKIPVLYPKHTACHNRHAYLSKRAYGSVGMVSRLLSRRPRNRGSIPGRDKRITFLQSICGCFGEKMARPPSHSVVKRFFPRGDATGA
jgi:hypothetical protein